MDLSHVHFQGRPTLRAQRARRTSVRLSAGHGGAAADPLAQPTVAGLPALVLSGAGLNPHVYRHGPLERRIAACLRALKSDSEAAAGARLQANRHLLDLALDTLLIGVSGFFRDPAVFDAIRGTVVPALANRPGALRVLSVGCSSGAEVYSVGTLLAEAGLLERSVLLGTDCRGDAIAKARSGVFTDDEVADVAPAVLARYFERRREGWLASAPLRAAAEWRIADATCEIPRGPWDVVLCRNLVIYLQPAAGEAIFRRIAGELVPGGFLVVGKAERPSPSLPLSAVGRCLYRSHAD